MLRNIERYQLFPQPTMVHETTGEQLKISHFKYVMKGELRPKTSLFLFYNDSGTGNFEMISFTSTEAATKYVKERKNDT